MQNTIPTLLALWAVPTLAGPSGAQTPLRSVEVAGGLSAPVCVAAPPGDERLFICEQNSGLVRVAQDGTVLPTPFLDLSGQLSTGGERGLLAIAFHPQYATNGSFFVFYTDPLGSSTVARYQVSSDPNVADAGSAELLFSLPQPYQNHNGGDLEFGPTDGYLYVSLGDGGGNGDPECRAQDLGSLYGTVLRLDVDGAAPYAIPPTNPFVGVPGVREEIWAYGLRHPWRMGFDRLQGDLYIADVGQLLREEVDFVPGGVGGLNFGWKSMEANLCFNTDGCSSVAPCGDPSYADPIHHVSHTGFFGPCSIIGGSVYRGCRVPDLQGTYFFSDFCLGHIWSFRFDGTEVSDYQVRSQELTPAGTTLQSITTFGEDGFGELLFAMYGSGADGAVYRIEPAAPPAMVDCDGNGLQDACEVFSFPAADLDGDGMLDACQELSADVAAISLTAGGVQTLALHAGAPAANQLYVVLGSVTGTAPGLPIGAVTVPLVVDFYTSLTLTSPNQPPLTDSVGNLDGSGAGTALFTVPAAAYIGLVGTDVFHAYATLDGALQAQLASNPVRVSLVL